MIIKTKPVSLRTLPENNYFHGSVVVAIAKHFKMETDVAKEFIKLVFGIKSTAALSTIEFEEFLNAVRVHAKRYWDLTILEPQ